MNDRIAQITQNFLDSYEELGGINHLSGPNLPSKLGILAIIDDVESLVFPGFKTEEAIGHCSLGFMVAEKLNRLIRNLSTEITRSLCYGRRVSGQGHDCHTDTCNDGPAGSESAHLDCQQEAEALAGELTARIPLLRGVIHKDVEAAFAGDPAAKSREEVILSYPGIEAITIHRVANLLWKMGVPLIPRMLSEVAHTRTGIDIHPGATIGEYFFIDHGTGVVIGETTEIGRHVKLYQGVTLGAASVKKEAANAKRHPTLEDEVTVYSGATILGGKTVIGRGSVIGGNVWITSSVAAGSRVYYKDPEYIVRNSFEYMPDFQI